ncbi:MAG: 4a-hydroxytetrahydrobiopterin dehydratase [Ardenticatenales bacterium]|jgi:4a-hydroxytetrahydrobiopterin dehydratase|nr:4a-hydroxytetrahydrobiopterin dehydratase [Ardenticatenales bacterium]
MTKVPDILTAAERAAALSALDGWTYADGALHKAYAFAGFVEAFAFMTAGALAAERLDHHPNWSNSYRKVDVSLSTHAAGGVTSLDIALATAMEGVAARLLA